MDDQILTEKTRMIMPKPICLPKEFSESIDVSYASVVRNLNGGQDPNDLDEEHHDFNEASYNNYYRNSYQNDGGMDL